MRFSPFRRVGLTRSLTGAQSCCAVMNKLCWLKLPGFDLVLEKESVLVREPITGEFRPLVPSRSSVLGFGSGALSAFVKAWRCSSERNSVLKSGSKDSSYPSSDSGEGPSVAGRRSAILVEFADAS